VTLLKVVRQRCRHSRFESLREAVATRRPVSPVSSSSPLLAPSPSLDSGKRAPFRITKAVSDFVMRSTNLLAAAAAARGVGDPAVDGTALVMRSLSFDPSTGIHDITYIYSSKMRQTLPRYEAIFPLACLQLFAANTVAYLSIARRPVELVAYYSG